MRMSPQFCANVSTGLPVCLFHEIEKRYECTRTSHEKDTILPGTGGGSGASVYLYRRICRNSVLWCAMGIVRRGESLAQEANVWCVANEGACERLTRTADY